MDHYEQHYAKVSSSYDCLYSDYSAANVSIINRHLRFTADDSILYIGEGTAEMHYSTCIFCSPQWGDPVNKSAKPRSLKEKINLRK